MNTRDERRNGGYVYFLEGPDGIYKIGRTKNIKQRFASFTKFPMQFKLVHVEYYDDERLGEQQRHQQFKQYKYRGEWYKIPKDIVVNVVNNADVTDFIDYGELL